MCAAYLGLTACSSADDKLAHFIEDTKHQPGGRVEPLPEIKPYEAFAYNDFSLRSPFLPSSPGSGAGQPQRNREFLEQYSLDTLEMVGTLRLFGQIYLLVETKDGLVHRVAPANIEAIRARLAELLRTGAKIDKTRAASLLAELEHIAAENAAARPTPPTLPDIDKHPFGPFAIPLSPCPHDEDEIKVSAPRGKAPSSECQGAIPVAEE